MGRIHRYYSALSRYHKSNGYGIHSPFAFKFVLNVLRERLPYYNYAEIKQVRTTIVNSIGKRFRHPRIMSEKNAKMLFRVVNYFNPQHILQIGTNYGMSSASMLLVSPHSHLSLYEKDFNSFEVTAEVLAPYDTQISLHSDIAKAIQSYKTELSDNESPFILINSLSEIDKEALWSLIEESLKTKGVVILRNLSRSEAMKELFERIERKAMYGMTFTNDKIAFFVINPKLPRQTFALWF